LSTDSEPRRRLFFALWPDGVVRGALATVADALPNRGGCAVPASNLHVTLAFAGAVNATTRECLAARADGIRGVSFLLRLTRVGYFPRSRILWLGADACPAALASLVRELNHVLENCGVKPDSRAYRPHVTLARSAAPAAACAVTKPIDWPVESFALVASRTGPEGAHYEVLRRFGLRSADAL
jgi:RNA 2',3'-cyclic 3'-phosphodiesterase